MARFLYVVLWHNEEKYPERYPGLPNTQWWHSPDKFWNSTIVDSRLNVEAVSRQCRNLRHKDWLSRFIPTRVNLASSRTTHHLRPHSNAVRPTTRMEPSSRSANQRWLPDALLAATRSRAVFFVGCPYDIKAGCQRLFSPASGWHFYLLRVPLAGVYSPIAICRAARGLSYHIKRSNRWPAAPAATSVRKKLATFHYPTHRQTYCLTSVIPKKITVTDNNVNFKK